MECTNCGLLNSENAERCDCGYDFASRSVMASYLPNHGTSPDLTRLLAFIYTVITFVAVGPPVGLLGYIFAWDALNEGIYRPSIRDFIILLYPAYIFGLIPALSTGMLYGTLRLILSKRITQAVFWRATLCGAIGAAVTAAYCQWSEINTGLILMAGLPAGIVCGILAPISNRLIRHKRVG